MTSINDLEKDIEESRARLDLTIERLQGRMTVSGLVDEAMGSVRTARGDLMDRALTVVRNNPVPVLLVVTGLAWLITRAAREGTGERLPVVRTTAVDDVPVMNTGHARVYDPDQSPLHPTQDVLETRREASAKA